MRLASILTYLCSEGGGEVGGRRESEGREDGKGRNREGTEGARERPMGGGGKQRSVEGRE